MSNLKTHITALFSIRQEFIFLYYQIPRYHDLILLNLLPHLTHPQSFFVAILYLNNSENNSGNLTLLNPNSTNDHLIPHDAIAEYTPYTRMYTRIPPTEKLLIVHPAWIMHYVSQEVPEENRMSIAFNFSLDLPKSNGFVFNNANPLMNPWINE